MRYSDESMIDNGQVLIGSDSSNWVAPTAGTGLSVNSNNSTLSYYLSTPVSVSNGGTNATSMATVDGVVYYNGTSLVTTSAGIVGQVLASNGVGNAPTFQAVPLASASGTIVNKKRLSSIVKASTTAICTIVTTPTTSNTTLLASLTFTPMSASNILNFQFNCPQLGSTATAYTAIFCLFQGSTLLNTIMVPSSGLLSIVTAGVCASMLYQKVAGTTSSTTYSIYYAVSATLAGLGTIYINQDANGDAYGNSLGWTFTITEEIP